MCAQCMAGASLGFRAWATVGLIAAAVVASSLLVSSAVPPASTGVTQAELRVKGSPR